MESNTMNKMYNDVKTFMVTFQQDVPKDFVDCKDATAQLRHTLISEEYREWQEASPLSEELLDSLTDLLYVTLGSLVAAGLKYLPPVRPLHITPSMRKGPIDHYVAMALHALAMRPLCRDRLQPALSELADQLIAAGELNCFNMAAAFNIVHTANMSKGKWKKSDIRPADSREIHVKDYVVVYNKAGKVIKPPGFVPPDLRPVLTEALRRFEKPAEAPAPSGVSAASSSPAAGPAEVPRPAPAAPVAAPQSRNKMVILPKTAKKT